MPLGFLQDGASIVVAGASGGLGAEFVRQLAADARVDCVWALHRGATPEFEGRVRTLEFDLGNEDSIRIAAEAVGRHGPIDAVIVATGLLHDNRVQPEKSLDRIDASNMLEAFRINAVGPILLAKHFLPLLRSERRSIFAALSARVGSIADNRLGGWASYRASKAALNMLLRTAAIEHKRRRPAPSTRASPLHSSAVCQTISCLHLLFLSAVCWRSLTALTPMIAAGFSPGTASPLNSEPDTRRRK